MGTIGTSSVPCTGDDGCPFCDLNYPTTEKYFVQVYDKATGRVMTCMMSAEQYRSLFDQKPLPWWRRLWQWVKSFFTRKV